jgi:hypothetical protein
MNLLQHNELLENIFYLSGIVLALAALFGLRQISLLKSDIRIRNTRMAREMSAAIIKYYMEEHCAPSNGVELLIQKKQVPAISWTGKTEDLDFLSPATFDKRIALSRLSSYVEIFQNGETKVCITDLLNGLEYVGACCNSGLPDEKLVFNSIGRSFCRTVEQFYDLIVVMRQNEGIRYYENAGVCYRRWKKWINAEILSDKKTKIDEELQRAVADRMKIIGVD